MKNAVEEVEKVATFLNKGSTRVGGEAIPVANLVQKGETMLAYGDHAGSSNETAVSVGDETGYGRHVGVFEADVGEAWTSFGEMKDLTTVGNCGAEGFFNEDMHVRVCVIVGVEEDFVVGKVGGGDDGKVAEIGEEELFGGWESFDGGGSGGTEFGEFGETGVEGGRVIIGYTGDEDVFIEGQEVVDMLHAHETDTDNAVGDGRAGGAGGSGHGFGIWVMNRQGCVTGSVSEGSVDALLLDC